MKNSYWISPFSNTKDLEELFSELNKTKLHSLIDLELPLLNKILFFKNIFSVWKNKKRIKQFLEKNKKRITTAEAPPILGIGLRKILGVDYNIETEKGLMWYSSMIPSYINKKTKRNLIKIKDKGKYTIGLGVIAKGVLSYEPLLSPKKLEKDLEFAKKSGFKKVCIFRLGGLNKDYMKVISKFQ